MSSIENKLKKFLITNAKDPAINLQKNNNVIDLVAQCKNIDDLDKFIKNDKVEKFQIKSSDDEIISLLKEENNFKKFIKILEENDLFFVTEIYEKWKENFPKNKLSILRSIDHYLSTTIKKFSYISFKSKKIREDKNIEPLYIGSFFVKGYLSDGSFVNSPILCYPININIDRFNKIIIISKISSPIVNLKLAMKLKNCYGIVINDELLNEQNYNIEKFINYCNETFNKSISNYIEDSLNIDKVKYPDEKFGEKITLVNNACVMLMDPNGGCIKQDIEEMINNGIEDPFIINSEINTSKKYENYQIENDDLIEINRPLNIYQKYAIHSALSENTLIYGPPGTGKSEVIATIIANIINKNKNVLMSSEKVAALNVLSDRLSRLNDLCLFIYNSEEKERFYNCLANMHELLFNDQSNAIINNSSSEKYNKLIYSIDLMNKLNEKFPNINPIEIFNKIDYLKFKNYQSNGILNTLLEIFKFSNLEIEEFIILFNKIINFYNTNKDIFDYIIESNFNLFNIDSLNEINQISDEVINNKLFWFNIFKHNKIKNKFGFLEKLSGKKFEMKFQSNQLINFFKELSKINNLNLLNKKIIKLVLDIKEINNPKEMIIWNSIQNFLIENNYDDYKSIDNLFKDYIKSKKLISKNNDLIILERYINNLKTKFNNLSKENKENVVKCLKSSQLQRKHDVNKIIKKYGDVLQFLFPVWILSPEKTCSLIQLESNIFDYGIFDEASQMFVENSFPLIYRCGINIVAGDSNQMPPSNWFASNIEDEESDDVDYENAESLLEKAEISNWPRFNLKNHYRSIHNDLIQFSNENIYENNLHFCTQNGVKEESIFVKNVNGIWNEKKINLIEAEEIIKLIKLINENNKNKKILVVTFNISQSEYLTKLLINNFADIEILKKYEDGEISIKNLENVQGDEGDIVIISVSYAKNFEGKLRQSFGMLSRKKDGYKRLNVAITRAKEKMYIVKSINSSDITHTSNKSTMIFKKFLEYVESINNRQNNNESIISRELKFDSTFEEEVYNELKNKLKKTKYELITQFPVGKKRIDIAVYDPENNHVVLGIEIDGYRYHSTPQKVLEDLDRQNFLEDRGYKMTRISEFDWTLRSNERLNEIVRMIK